MLAKHTTQRASSAVYDFVIARTLTVVSVVLFLVFLENGSNSVSFAIHYHKTIKLLVQCETYLNLSTANSIDYLWDRSNSPCISVLMYAVLILLFFKEGGKPFFTLRCPS